MVQLNDLSDYCLLEVLDWLSPEQLLKIQRVSTRIKQLANEKLRTKVKAISLCTFDYKEPFPSCSHLGPVSKNRMLFLFYILGVEFELHKSPKSDLLMNVLSKCLGVKSIDFHCYTLFGDVLLQVFRRCPQLECIKLWDLIKVNEWERFLKQHGNKLVHIIKEKPYDEPTEARQLAMIAEKCTNIRLIEWTYDKCPASDLVAAFKMLDKSCRVSVHCSSFVNNVFEDVFDELDISWVLVWSQFGDRLNRLSSLKFNLIHYDTDQYRGIRFDGLKKLDFSDSLGYDQQFVNCLFTCQFPLLEEFSFNTLPGLDEDDYNRLFKQMVSLKILKLFSNVSIIGRDKCMRLPRSSIYQLKNLEAIELKLTNFSDNWHISILEPLEHYADGIESLKKITVETRGFYTSKEASLIKKIEDEAKRLLKIIKLKHNRIEVNLVCYKPPNQSN